jgi:hypothetical protein
MLYDVVFLVTKPLHEQHKQVAFSFIIDRSENKTVFV